jgi:hypothetical protein
MKTNDRPSAFGVFKPVGHIIVAFPTDGDTQEALTSLLQNGFVPEDINVYSPEQMKRQADIDIEQAGVLAGIGQELNLVKAHRELAEKGHSFLVVKASDDEKAEQVATISRRCHATRAQRYGRLVIEELIEVGSEQNQVPESPDLGLDAQTRSGREAGTATR